MKEKEIDLFELRDLVLGMTVYHPNARFGKNPVVLNGIRLNRRMEGYDVQVELLYPDGKLQWTGINGLSTAPEYHKKKDFMAYACDIKSKLANGDLIEDAKIKALVDIVTYLVADVQGAKGW